jgi:hypothetical protein
MQPEISFLCLHQPATELRPLPVEFILTLYRVIQNKLYYKHLRV